MDTPLPNLNTSQVAVEPGGSDSQLEQNPTQALPLIDANAVIHCFCKQRDNGLMIQCEKCQNWFHLKCVGLTKAMMRAYEHWFCKDCLLEIGDVDNYIPQDQQSTSNQVNSAINGQNATGTGDIQQKGEEVDDESSILRGIIIYNNLTCVVCAV
ncbi:MAG: hypothetical protein EZS28_031147 [Streblomastix strix]|uniref:PHD-type domain-containing protein n=1 Tax=Streblomastix strix TaxID=222440 RepID=A0A5J4USE5_9EUKA|nr:MAG: hypothetical protein EZS28_031147 [Streblomastix strix]